MQIDEKYWDRIDHDLRQIDEGMDPTNKSYRKLLRRLAELGKRDQKVTKTMYWCWLVDPTKKADMPHVFFEATPPIKEAPASDRVLIVGTADYLIKMDSRFSAFTKAKYTDSFWPGFFGTYNYLDDLDRISIPSRIVTSGKIRDYGSTGGQTLDARVRLKQIASAWGIPLEVTIANSAA